MDTNKPRVKWEDLEKYFLDQFRHVPEELLKRTAGNSTQWIGRYIEQVIKRCFPPSNGLTSSYAEYSWNVSYDLFETHRSIIVRIPVSDKLKLDQMRVSAGRMKLKVKLAEQTLQINLPKPVNPDLARAECKYGYLEIRLPKSTRKEPMQDVPIY